ncbi:C-C chemokine receptor type 6 [Stomoxys calcitrans]|uniref:C-C chemokine receptor type 6 n=1 Tax=Stomoxys calcitrans TaxID=35570 RepID=UPI0027E23091|nr:C-C chemokine receptor type 6 [Stomoxys calcitrans]
MQCIESTKTFATTTITTSLTAVLLSSISPDSSLSKESDENVECVWRRGELSAVDFVIYAFVVPSLAFFGLCANFINAMVFMRPKMTPSAFSYLAALSWLDCVSCMLITLTAFSRSFFYSSNFWMAYDFQWQTPLFGISTGAANLILACVSLDRFIYLRRMGNGTPAFCRRIVARHMIVAAILIAIAINMPYFFVFVVNDDGSFETTPFYFSKYYMVHNWLTFVLLTLLPAIFLMVGNTAILIAFCRWTKKSKKCKNSNYSKTTKNRYKHQMKLTITILIVITLYLVGELPAHLTSRKCAVNLLYGGDVTKVDFKTMQQLEVICITLNAIQLSMNIIVYAVINPSFMPEFFDCLKGVSDVCFKYMGITYLANYCGTLRFFQTKGKEQCEKPIPCNNELCANAIEVDWQDEEIMGSENNRNQCDIEISTITPAQMRVAFDNPTFVIDSK